MEATRYKLASNPLVTPPAVINLIPPSGIEARLMIDSRRFDSFHALLPFLAIDFLLVPSGLFLTMYGFSSRFSPRSNRALFTTYLSSMTSVRSDRSLVADSEQRISSLV